MNRKNQKKWQKTKKFTLGILIIGLLTFFTTTWVKLFQIIENAETVINQPIFTEKSLEYNIIIFSIFSLMFLLGWPIYRWCKSNNFMANFSTIVIIAEIFGIITALALKDYGGGSIFLLLFSFFPVSYWLLLLSIARFRAKKEAEEETDSMLRRVHTSYNNV